MDQLFIVTKNGYEILYEKNCEFLQDESYIMIGDTIISKSSINEIAVFQGRLCVLTFDMEKINTYQKMLEKVDYRKI